MSKHTPGPWKAGKDSHDRGRVFGSGYWLATTWHFDDTDTGPDRRVALANARLIAAAPDLLAACKGLRAVIHDFLTHNEQTDCAVYIEAADAALAKAEGGAQ